MCNIYENSSYLILVDSPKNTARSSSASGSASTNQMPGIVTKFKVDAMFSAHEWLAI